MTSRSVYPGTIVALSGGGFTLDAHPQLDTYVLGLLRIARPRICFIPTASSDSPSAIERFYRRFSESAYEPSHLALCRMARSAETADTIRRTIERQDLIYVGGGNAGDLLEVWARHDFGPLLFRSAPTVLAGVSAGAACWFEHFVSDSLGPEFGPMRGLGFLPGSYCPHYDNEPSPRPVFRRLVAEGFAEGYAADDAVALHFSQGSLKRVFHADAGARAYRVERDPSGGVTERVLEPSH